MIKSQVVCWRPVQRDAFSPPEGGEDIAVLGLVDNPPSGCPPAPLASADDFWGHSFRAFGFPAGYDDGVWASLVLRDRQASGWVQIEDVNSTGYFVAPGFSGTSIWDDKENAAVGMVVGANGRTEVRAAFIIPTPMLAKAWPELGQRSIPPGPHRGLFAFRERDAPFFFGREAFTEKLLEAVRKKPFVVVIKLSGSGKSSVVFASLIPHLHQESNWLIAHCRPGDRPLQGLAAALIPLMEPQLTEVDRLVEVKKQAKRLCDGELALRDVLESISRKNPDFHLLLVADQFEELYTLCAEAEARKQFLDGLLQALAQEPSEKASGFTLVITPPRRLFRPGPLLPSLWRCPC